MNDKKYFFGSRMLKMNNCRDEDWLVFVDAPKGTTLPPRHRPIRLDILRTQSFIDGKNKHYDGFKAWIIYQYSCEFHSDADYPLNHFNILEHKKVWIEQLKGYMNLDSTEQCAMQGNILPKKFYHILYQYYMIVENTHWISDAARVDVQKIHDLEMPSSYFYELKGLINSL